MKQNRKEVSEFDLKHKWLVNTENKLTELHKMLADNAELQPVFSTLGELVQCVHCSILYVTSQANALTDDEFAILDNMTVPECVDLPKTCE